MKRAPHLHLSIVAALVLGCTPRYLLPAPRTCFSDPGPLGGLTAAPLAVDITPPIGLSMAGHGAEGRIGTGTLTRLECRGFALRWPGDGMVWVVCDLQGISLMLQRRLAELVYAATGLGADRVLLTATHTHAAPSGYFEANAFINSMGGTRDPFYDQRVTDFIARRVADEVTRKWTGSMQPAELRYAESEVRGVNRNRAMQARVLDAREFVARDAGMDELDPAHLNVDRRLALLRVDSVGAGVRTPMGLLGVFGVHATAMPNTNERYHGDLFAFARRFCESELRAQHPGGPICAIAPGALGDASPDWGAQGLDEAERLGARLGLHLVRTFALADAAAGETAMTVRYQEALLPGAPAPGGRLARVPEVGAPAAAGAPDGIVRFRILEQMQPGMIDTGREATAPEHAPRLGVLGFVPSTGELASSGYMFPPVAPMWWVRVGTSHVFATVPMEPTAASAARLAVIAAHGADSGVIVAHTGSYLNYLVTAEEYRAQQYEGASCPYGWRTQAFVEERLRELAAHAQAPPARQSCPVGAPAAATSGVRPPGRDNAACPATHPGLAFPGPQWRLPGEVGVACASPAPALVRSRWPEGLDFAAACPAMAREEAPIDAPSERSQSPRTESVREGSARTITWCAPRTMPLCGPARVRLVDRHQHPISALRSQAPAGASLYPDPWSEQPWHPAPPAGPCGPPGPTLPIDDLHGFIEVWFDDQVSGGCPDGGTWNARFRPPHTSPLLSAEWAAVLDDASLVVLDESGHYRAPPRPSEMSP